MSEAEPRKVVVGWVEGADLVLLARRGDGPLEEVRRPAEHSAFIREEDLKDEVRRGIRTSQLVLGASTDGKHLRVRFRDSVARKQGVETLRGLGLDVYEGDVPPLRRFLADTGAPVGRPRRCFLDLETDSRVPFHRKERARILCTCVVGEGGEERSFLLEEDSDAAERRLLADLWKCLEGWDQVCAWNGDRFDFPVLQARTEKLGCPSPKTFRRWLWLDQMLLFKRMVVNTGSAEEKTSLKLEDVARYHLGRGKRTDDDGGELGARTWEMWSSGGERRTRMVDYCMEDVRLLLDLERKLGQVEMLGTICEVCQCFPDTWGVHPTEHAEGYLLRLGTQKGIRFPTREWKPSEEAETERKKFRGADVLEPDARGIEKDVHVFDFASLYPSIIISWNISPENKVKGCPVNGPIPEGACRAPTTGVGFGTREDGLLPFACREMLRLRRDWKAKRDSLPPGTEEWKAANRKSDAYKVAANSFYGVVGSPFSRFYDRECGESVSRTGAWLLGRMLEAVGARGWKAIYGDTDSGFAKGCSAEEAKGFAAWCNRELFPPLLAKLGCRECLIDLAYEKELERIVFVSAKRYCNPPEAPIWMADGSFKPLGEVKVGDRIFGWVPGKRTPGLNEPGRKWFSKRRLEETEVLEVHRTRAPLVRVEFASGRTLRCTEDHRWASYGRSGAKCEYVPPKIGRTFSRVLDVPRVLSAEEQRHADWLGGLWDGEGSTCGDNRGQIVFSQSRKKNPEVCSRIEEAFSVLGFDHSEWLGRNKDRPCSTFAIKGGLQERVEFLTWCRPAKGDRLRGSLCKSRFSKPDKVVSITPDGEGEVLGLTTTSGNYVAWGFASKNCARYRTYKGASATEDSEPEVKGLEMRRGDSGKLARALQKRCIDLLMRERCEDPAAFDVLVSDAAMHVLDEPLLVDEVVLSKSLTKPLKDYASKAKLDGTRAAGSPHVRIAKLLKERGREIAEGVRIEYYVYDASASPAVVKPAEDYAGDVDRFWLWETVVWKPTRSLLSAAFPDRDWGRWDKVRPKKERAAKVGTGKVDLPDPPGEFRLVAPEPKRPKIARSLPAH